MFDGNANARLYNPAVISVGSGRLLMYARVSTVTHQTLHLVLLTLQAVSGCLVTHRTLHLVLRTLQAVSGCFGLLCSLRAHMLVVLLFVTGAYVLCYRERAT